MLATDPLSLLFLGCALFAGLFLVATVALGVGHGHLGHLGHFGHVGGHVGGAGHVGGHTAQIAGHAGAHSSASHAAQPTQSARIAGQADTPPSVATGWWAGAQSALLGSLSLNGALVFLLVFGVVGYLLHSGQGGSIFIPVALGALVGALAAIGVNAALARIFITSQAGELSTASSHLEGRLATVSIAIRAQGLGEVVFTGEAGARQSIGARSAGGAAIPAETQVVIVAAERGLATVQPWESFLEESRQRPSAAVPRLEPGAAPATSAAPPGAEPPRDQ